jgi:hypothetical protein
VLLCVALPAVPSKRTCCRGITCRLLAARQTNTPPIPSISCLQADVGKCAAVVWVVLYSLQCVASSLLCAGAAWLDINCGCPIYEATKRGLGAALLRKPTKLAKMVAGIAAQVDLPITVKIRTGQRLVVGADSALVGTKFCRFLQLWLLLCSCRFVGGLQASHSSLHQTCTLH